MAWQKWATDEHSKAKAATARMKKSAEATLAERRKIADLRGEQLSRGAAADPATLRDLAEREDELRGKTLAAADADRQLPHRRSKSRRGTPRALHWTAPPTLPPTQPGRPAPCRCSTPVDRSKK
jgi:hypothetical protein